MTTVLKIVSVQIQVSFFLTSLLCSFSALFRFVVQLKEGIEKSI